MNDRSQLVQAIKKQQQRPLCPQFKVLCRIFSHNIVHLYSHSHLINNILAEQTFHITSFYTGSYFDYFFFNVNLKDNDHFSQVSGYSGVSPTPGDWRV